MSKNKVVESFLIDHLSVDIGTRSKSIVIKQALKDLKLKRGESVVLTITSDGSSLSISSVKKE